MKEMTKVAIFDFDGTIFPKETIPYLLKAFGRLGYSKYRLTIAYIKIVSKAVRYKISKNYKKEAFEETPFAIFLKYSKLWISRKWKASLIW